MNDEMRKFRAGRDKAVEGLVRCERIMNDMEIVKLGFTLKEYKSIDEGDDQYEYSVYTKNDKVLVYIESYVEREGGLYFQSMFADKSTAEELANM